MDAAAGIGLKARHQEELLAARPPLAFVEVHAENYMGAGGPPHRWLDAVREHYPLSVHGVGLSLGGADPLDEEHLDALAAVVERHRPALVSEHLAFAASGGTYLNDLIPIPTTAATLRHVAARVERTQDRLGRAILVENPSSYIAYVQSDITEAEFLAELSRRTGCGILWTSTTCSSPPATWASTRTPIWRPCPPGRWERSTWPGTMCAATSASTTTARRSRTRSGRCTAAPWRSWGASRP